MWLRMKTKFSLKIDEFGHNVTIFFNLDRLVSKCLSLKICLLHSTPDLHIFLLLCIEELLVYE